MELLVFISIAIILATIVNASLDSQPLHIKPKSCKLHSWINHEQGFLVCSRCGCLPGNSEDEII